MSNENHFTREFKLGDGRPIMLDKMAIGFATPAKDDPHNLTIICPKNTLAKPFPIACKYEDFAAWWRHFPPKPVSNRPTFGKRVSRGTVPPVTVEKRPLKSFADLKR